MLRSSSDLIVLLALCGLIACKARPMQLSPPGPMKCPGTNTPMAGNWVDEHHDPTCSGRKVARIEELRVGDRLQGALIERGLVVYVAGYLGCFPTPSDPQVECGRAIWFCGSGFSRNPIPGKSWYCKNCGEHWGELEESLLDHP